MVKIDKSFVKVKNLKKYFQTGTQIPFLKNPPLLKQLKTSLLMSLKEKHLVS